MTTESLETPGGQFTIANAAADDRRGTRGMEWGTFRWSAPLGTR